MFDPEQEELEQALERIKQHPAGVRYATDVETWDRFYESLLDFA